MVVVSLQIFVDQKEVVWIGRIACSSTPSLSPYLFTTHSTTYMITISSISSCVFLTTILSLPLFSYAGVSISYITTSVGTTCSNVCLAHGLKCYDNLIEEMSCSYAARQVCKHSLTDTSGNYHCDKGGCYVGCADSVYASRGTQYWTCNTQPICHVTSSTSGDYHNYLQVCPCALTTDDDSTENTSVHLLAWQIMGLLFFFSCCALGAVQLIAILFPDLFPSK